tara:strand:- start:1929 stop:2162 length:234 start_codon:yes stop_codon:yes gene_type:complete
MNSVVRRTSILIPVIKTKKDMLDYALDTKLIPPSVYKKMILHKSNHSVKHLSFMINQIKRGETYDKAHKLALIRVGV